jgi:molybdopterin converting factor small subunit
VRDLRAALTEQFPQLAPLAPNLLVALGTDYAGDNAELPATAEIAVFPPVSGG